MLLLVDVISVAAILSLGGRIEPGDGQRRRLAPPSHHREGDGSSGRYASLLVCREEGAPCGRPCADGAATLVGVVIGNNVGVIVRMGKSEFKKGLAPVISNR